MLYGDDCSICKNYLVGIFINLLYSATDNHIGATIFFLIWFKICDFAFGFLLYVFQTLDSDGEAMHTMAGLLADFIIELRAFTNTHQSDFIWKGVSLFPCDGSGERLKLSLCCDDMETALALKDQLLEKYPIIEVRDNGTRKVEMYKRTENK